MCVKNTESTDDAFYSLQTEDKTQKLYLLQCQKISEQNNMHIIVRLKIMLHYASSGAGSNFLLHMEYKTESQKIDLHNHFYTLEVNMNTIPRSLISHSLAFINNIRTF